MKIKGKKYFRVNELIFLVIILSVFLPCFFSHQADTARAEKAKSLYINKVEHRKSIKVSRGAPRELVEETITIPSPTPQENLINFALEHVGKRYKSGGIGPNSFDCSGFTMYCFRALGVELPHSSRAQFKLGVKISKEELMPADLVFFGSKFVRHVGIYVGEGRFIHAPQTGKSVRIDLLSQRKDYLGARRINS